MRFRPLLRSLALPFLAGFLVLGLACKGSHKGSDGPANTVTLSGTITFERKVMLRDVNGVPTGVEATPSLLNQPARGAVIVLYRQLDITENSVTKTFFVREATSYTGTDGTYKVTMTKGERYMLELQAAATIRGSGSNDLITLYADDPAHGMYSTVPVNNRLRYCIRKAIDGTAAPTAPSVNHVATSLAASDTTLNFHVGVGDSWFLADADFDRNILAPNPFIVPGYSPGSSGYQQAGVLEPVATGSKPLAILDSILSFAYCQGTGVTALQLIPGGLLDLHYYPGVTQSKGTFIEWDRSTYPLVPGPSLNSVAFDPNVGALHFLGCISGGSTDDAWDEGKLLTLAARAYYFNAFSGRREFLAASLSGPKAPLPINAALPDLEAQMALLEGMPEAFAAVIQKNPNVGLGGVNVATLGSLPDAQKTIYSAPLIRALGWQIALKAQGIAAPGTVSQWSTIDVRNVTPFFLLVQVSDFNDTPNLYLQLKSISSATGTNGGINPSAIFTESAVQTLLASAPLSVPGGNIPWFRPTSGPLANTVVDWGVHPSGALPSMTLSMSKAALVGSTYPNLSQGELQFARFTQFGVKRYAMNVSMSPSSLSGGQVEITFLSTSTPIGTLAQTYLFSGSSVSPTIITLDGLANADSTQMVRIRMLSPTTVQPDTTVTLTLTPQN